MRKTLHDKQVARVEQHLGKLAVNAELTADELHADAERIVRVISRVTHFQVTGDQRKTTHARAEMDAQVVKNVGAALDVL